MLERDVVNQKLKDVFGSDYSTEVILEGNEKSLYIIETPKDYALVTIATLPDCSIGDYEVFVEIRIKKSSNHLKDMANIIEFLQVDTVRNIETLHGKIEELTNEMKEVTKDTSKRFILSNLNSR